MVGGRRTRRRGRTPLGGRAVALYAGVVVLAAAGLRAGPPPGDAAEPLPATQPAPRVAVHPGAADAPGAGRDGEQAEPRAPAAGRELRPGVRPVPADAAAAEARRSLRQRWSRDYADVTAAGKRRLAGLLLREAGETSGDALLWAALTESRDLAVSAGDAEIALAAAGELGRRFDVDADTQRTTVLHLLANQRLSAGQAAYAARSARSLAEAMLSRDEFDTAARLAGCSERLAGQSGDGSLAMETAQWADFCRDVVRRSGGFRAALERLRDHPDDASANQTAGEFLTLVKREWARGLLMLSRGTHPRLKSAASAELGGAVGEELLSAADDWRAWGMKQQGPARGAALEHAYGLYRRAAADLTGEALSRCRASAGEAVLAVGPGELADQRSARLRLGEARWGWWSSLRVGALSWREDSGELVHGQAVLAWSPPGEVGDEVGEPPEGDGGRGEVVAVKGQRLTYSLKVLCQNERGETTVLSEQGRVTWRSADKPLRLPGPKNAAIKRVNGGRVVPHAAWVELRLDGVVVAERYWRLPNRKAWWLGT